MKKILISFTAILLLGFSGQAYAQSEETPSLTIYPSIIEVSEAPKGTVTEAITVRNDSGLIIPVTVEVLNYSIDARGIPSYISDGLEWNPTDWITIDPSDIILEANGQRLFKIQITIPDGAVAGSHFAAIIFKPIMPPGYFDTHSTHIVPYIGAIVGINVEGEEFDVSSDFLDVEIFKQTIPEDNSEVLFSTSLHNNDVYYHKVEGDIVVTNLLDNIVVREEVKGVTLFPESSREFENTYDSRLPFGRYTATLNIEGEGDQASEVVTFWVEPTFLEVVVMVLILLGAVISIAVAYLLFKKRQNVVKAIKVLFKKRIV